MAQVRTSGCVRALAGSYWMILDCFTNSCKNLMPLSLLVALVAILGTFSFFALVTLLVTPTPPFPQIILHALIVTIPAIHPYVVE